MYHINPVTGRPNQCRAAQRCPFGGQDEHFATKEEARAQFETAMSASTVLPPLKKAQSNSYRLRERGYTDVEYEYDSYYCSDPVECSESGDYCRDRVYEGLRVERVTVDDVYDYARSMVGAAHGKPLPPDLQAHLDARMEEWTDVENWEALAEPGYYGEEAYVEEPRELRESVRDWFYSQAGAVDEDRVLPYLRSVGVDTTGKDPLAAVKDFLAQANGGVRLPAVEAARSLEVQSLSLSSIGIPNRQHYASAAGKEPKKTSSDSRDFAGIVLETKKGPVTYDYRSGKVEHVGEVKLVDGYHRMKFLQLNGRRKATYIVLRK